MAKEFCAHLHRHRRALGGGWYAITSITLTSITFTYRPLPNLRALEEQAVLDLQCSFRGGNLAPECVAVVRAAELAYIRESTNPNPLIKRAQLLAWAGLGLIELPVLAKALPILRTYVEQAQNDGERQLALKAITLIDAIMVA